MTSQSKPPHLPQLCINKEIWYPPYTDTLSKTPTTADSRNPCPRNTTLLPHRKRKSRFFPQPLGDGSKKLLTNPLPFTPPATPLPTPQSPSLYYPIRCSPILPSPSLLLPLSVLPSPVPPPPLSPIAPPSPYPQPHQRNSKEDEAEDEEAYEKLGSASLLKDNPFHLKDSISFPKETTLCLENNISYYPNDRVPYFGSGHAPSGCRDIDTPAVKRFFRSQWERRVWEVLLRSVN